MATLRGKRHRWAAWLLALAGWRVEGDVPPIDKAVLAIAPHTSNWDFIVLVLAKFALGLHVTFIGKHSIFWGPLGWWLRSMGGIPVDRSRPGGIVAQMTAAMQSADKMYFALAPEGTRSLTAGWKTGFYRIASGAAAPIVPVIIDAASRQVRIGEPMVCSGDIEADFNTLATMFNNVAGIRATLASPVKPL